MFSNHQWQNSGSICSNRLALTGTKSKGAGHFLLLLGSCLAALQFLHNTPSKPSYFDSAFRKFCFCIFYLNLVALTRSETSIFVTKRLSFVSLANRCHRCNQNSWCPSVLQLTLGVLQFSWLGCVGIAKKPAALVFTQKDFKHMQKLSLFMSVALTEHARKLAPVQDQCNTSHCLNNRWFHGFSAWDMQPVS